MSEVQDTGPEAPIWRSSPSQFMEWPRHTLTLIIFVTCLAVLVVSRVQGWPMWTTFAFAGAAAFCVLFLGWIFATVATVQYELSSERIRETTGIVSRKLEEIELYRVKDISVTRSPIQLARGCATITLETSDATRPKLALQWIPQFRDKHESIRSNVERCRLKHRARVVEFEGDDLDGDLV